MARELRTFKRRHLIYYLEVIDAESNQILGHLVDLTPKGLMLISKEPIEKGRAFSLRMKLPEDIVDEPHLEFHAKSLWTGKDINPDFYDTGFEVIDLPPRAKEFIQHLIEQMGFSD